MALEIRRPVDRAVEGGGGGGLRGINYPGPRDVWGSPPSLDESHSGVPKNILVVPLWGEKF